MLSSSGDSFGRSLSNLFRSKVAVSRRSSTGRVVGITLERSVDELATLVVTEPELNWKIFYSFEDDFNDDKDVDNL